MQTKLIMQLKY